jgi:hypothetical protein
MVAAQKDSSIVPLGLRGGLVDRSSDPWRFPPAKRRGLLCRNTNSLPGNHPYSDTRTDADPHAGTDADSDSLTNTVAFPISKTKAETEGDAASKSGIQTGSQHLSQTEAFGDASGDS